MSIVNDATALHYNTLVNVFGTDVIAITTTTLVSSGAFNPTTGSNITETTVTNNYVGVRYNDLQNQDSINVFDNIDYLINTNAPNVVNLQPIRLRDDMLVNGIKYEVIDIQTFVGSDIIHVKGKKKL